MAKDPQPRWVGVDLGTSWAKAAAWGPDGTRIAHATAPMPPLTAGVQDAHQVREAGEAALRALGLTGQVHRIHLAFTTQRDTLLWVDRDGNPASPLLSWRVRQDLEDPERRAEFLAPWMTPEKWKDAALNAIPLEEWLGRVWGERIPGWDVAIQSCTFAGGDKNCEYHALGLRLAAPGVAGVSLGSAISLGVAIPRTDRSRVHASLPPGVVASPGVGAGGEDVWHLETGVLSGMGGLPLLLTSLGLPLWEAPLPPFRVPEVGASPLRCIPWFGGALDDPNAQPQLLFRDEAQGGSVVNLLTGETGSRLPNPPEVVAAWAEGVVDELARFRPLLESMSTSPIRELRVTGGGTGSGPSARDWGVRLAWKFKVPVRVYSDPWLGCRGAVEIAGAEGLEAVSFQEVAHG